SAAAMSSSSALVPTATIVSPSTRIASGGGVAGSQNSGGSESSGGAKVRTTALENRRMTTSLEWPITGAVDPSAPGAVGGRAALPPSGFDAEYNHGHGTLPPRRRFAPGRGPAHPPARRLARAPHRQLAHRSAAEIHPP